jgi:hypothetical protein
MIWDEEIILERTANATVDSKSDSHIQDNRKNTSHTESEMMEASPRFPGGCPGGRPVPGATDL